MRENDPNSAELAAARRELVVAKVDARHYWQVEYPRQRRELNAAITLTDAEVRAMKRLLREYGPFSRFSTGQPLFLPIQDLKLCILDAELRLRRSATSGITSCGFIRTKLFCWICA